MSESDYVTSAEERVKMDEIKRYCSENVIAISEKDSLNNKCVDGRYLPDQERGKIARPGGDLGYVMVLLALNKEKELGLTPKLCFQAVYGVVNKNGGKFNLHSDNHSEPGGFGCGHVFRPTSPDLAEAYELNSEEVSEVIEHAKEQAQKDPNINLIMLKGEHQEEAVLVMEDLQHSVASSDGQGKMFFVYDKARDMKYIKEVLLPGLGIDGISLEDFVRISDIQTMATLRNLAKGKIIYGVNFNRVELVKNLGLVA